MSLKSENLHGTFTALVTPFDDTGSRIDEDSFAQLIASQLQAKINGLVVCGSTGEAVCLTLPEYEGAVGLTRQCAGKTMPIVAGISHSSTERAIEAARVARNVGADALLISAPPYNKPSQEGIYRHVCAVAEASGLPVIAYNIPGRSAVGIAPDTVVRLAKIGVVIGAKEATGSVDAVLDLLAIAPPSLSVLAGDDSLVWPIMSCGGVGTISASANVAPQQFVALTNAGLGGDCAKARQIQMQLLPVIRALFVEANPGPAKAALWLQGIIKSPTVRLPLLRASEATVGLLKERLSL
jgi:4-hydroxy-tetrahydrodipicolinate synthase